MIDLRHGDCLEVMRTLADNSVDSLVTDPPYHLTNNGGGPHNKTPNAYSRAQAGAGSGGFMGKAWDGGDIAFQPATWVEAMRVLKPGGYLLAFSGTRTYHRMACAIEDAGFEIRDQIGWAYGSGFPKSHNGPWGGTALKPAWEPICVARKPLIGTVEANWREHGTGAMNIDGCRVETNSDVDDPRLGGKGDWSSDKMAKNVYEGGYAGERVASSPLGRWPANLIHDGSDEVLATFPDAPGAMAPVFGDEPSSSTGTVYGKFKRAASDRTGEASACSENGGVVGFKMRPGARRDGTSAARFFYCAKADRADRNEGMADPGPRLKSGATLRDAENLPPAGNHHPTVKPTDLMRYLCRLVTPAGGLVLDPFMGSGSTGRGAVLEGFRFIGIEREAEYIEIARARIDSARRQGHQPSLNLEAA